MKRCTRCGETKPLDQFYIQRNRGVKGVYYSYPRPECRACSNALRSKWSKANRERWNAYKREYRSRRRAAQGGSA